MYKVVVVDDEPIIVKGLTKLVPWEKYGCKVVSTAGDGMEGIQVIREYRPDIIFSDIYMPKMNGLLMAAALKSEFEDTELTILTGYRDFDLAQEAIRLGVTRFILKPSNMEELEEALLVMVQNLQRRGITGEEDTVTGETKAAAGSFLVNKALEYMRKNYRQKVTLTDVAESVFVSQWHLSKLLNHHTGQSFSELLNHIRVEEAKKQLEDPALRVSDVAEQVGFTDVAHFSRVFKKITGISANEYRNHLK
ncbi:MAG: response regulator transcription factor [Marvinbryantia sp.]|jgi:two-component system response regulator YesN